MQANDLDPLTDLASVEEDFASTRFDAIAWLNSALAHHTRTTPNPDPPVDVNGSQLNEQSSGTSSTDYTLIISALDHIKISLEQLESSVLHNARRSAHLVGGWCRTELLEGGGAHRGSRDGSRPATSEMSSATEVTEILSKWQEGEVKRREIGPSIASTSAHSPLTQSSLRHQSHLSDVESVKQVQASLGSLYPYRQYRQGLSLHLASQVFDCNVRMRELMEEVSEVDEGQRDTLQLITCAYGVKTKIETARKVLTDVHQWDARVKEIDALLSSASRYQSTHPSTEVGVNPADAMLDQIADTVMALAEVRTVLNLIPDHRPPDTETAHGPQLSVGEAQHYSPLPHSSEISKKVRLVEDFEKRLLEAAALRLAGEMGQAIQSATGAQQQEAGEAHLAHQRHLQCVSAASIGRVYGKMKRPGMVAVNLTTIIQKEMSKIWTEEWDSTPTGFITSKSRLNSELAHPVTSFIDDGPTMPMGEVEALHNYYTRAADSLQAASPVLLHTLHGALTPPAPKTSVEASSTLPSSSSPHSLDNLHQTPLIHTGSGTAEAMGEEEGAIVRMMMTQIASVVQQFPCEGLSTYIKALDEQKGHVASYEACHKIVDEARVAMQLLTPSLTPPTPQSHAPHPSVSTPTNTHPTQTHAHTHTHGTHGRPPREEPSVWNTIIKESIPSLVSLSPELPCPMPVPSHSVETHSVKFASINTVPVLPDEVLTYLCVGRRHLGRLTLDSARGWSLTETGVPVPTRKSKVETGDGGAIGGEGNIVVGPPGLHGKWSPSRAVQEGEAHASSCLPHLAAAVFCHPAMNQRLPQLSQMNHPVAISGLAPSAIAVCDEVVKEYVNGWGHFISVFQNTIESNAATGAQSVINSLGLDQTQRRGSQTAPEAPPGTGTNLMNLSSATTTPLTMPLDVPLVASCLSLYARSVATVLTHSVCLVAADVWVMGAREWRQDDVMNRYLKIYCLNKDPSFSYPAIPDASSVSAAAQLLLTHYPLTQASPSPHSPPSATASPSPEASLHSPGDSVGGAEISEVSEMSMNESPTSTRSLEMLQSEVSGVSRGEGVGGMGGEVVEVSLATLFPKAGEALRDVINMSEMVAITSAIGGAGYILDKCYWRLPHWVQRVDHSATGTHATASTGTPTPTSMIYGIGEHLLSLVPLLEEHTQGSSMFSALADHNNPTSTTNHTQATGTTHSINSLRRKGVPLGWEMAGVDGAHFELLPKMLSEVQRRVCLSVLNVSE
eukprot:GHVN01068321.1.p1 GENE.GHVN01068321.1~~GHVN01068321.1.p1  ORF type:complete len:1236 (+),score=358.73 GHVN01068321.1:105-3812(+)